MGGIISRAHFHRHSGPAGSESSPSTEPSAGIENPDILRLVFGRLDQDDRISAAQVCGAWRAVADDARVWRDFEAQLSLSHSGDSPVLRSLERRGIQRIKVANPDDTLTRLPRLLRKLPVLKTLDLSHCENLTDERVGTTFEPRPCTSLTSLNLSWCSKITDVAVDCITRQIPNLEILCLSGCRSVSDWAMGLIAMRLRRLIVLEVRACNISNDGLLQIAGFSPDGAPLNNMGGCQLEQLNVRFCVLVSDVGLEAISRGMRHLVSLDLRRCADVTDAGVEHVAKIATLKRLVLNRCGLVTGDGIYHLASRPSSLDELDIGACRRIGNGITNIFQGNGIVGVTKLHAQSCGGVSDSVLGMLSERFVHLTELDISDCKLVTCKGIKALSTSMRELRCIHLCWCPALTNRALRHLSRMPSLRTVSLKGCRKITGKCVKAASGENTPSKLTELDVGYTGVGDTGLRYIAQVKKTKGCP
ncbi:hypothetical protein HPB48_009161 [Haemaphysalis longicornis]|uniref:F-box domain-containing protein n=1 Tax=Haemaphysalis longicornis TaxID=44386 RepID=A0A9J6GCY7_HAELO|nr:hypothetical protein HPB48_009161 [Haemaphysalis longicornis]